MVKSVCNGDDLHASISEIIPKGSNLIEYTWSLGGIPVTNGNITDNTVPGLTYNHVNVLQNESLLELAVSNGCGTTTVQRSILVWETPPLPTPIVKDYCQGETPVKLSIIEDLPVWYEDINGIIGAPIPTAPTPDTSSPKTQTWWVSHRVYYHADAICESDRRKVTVETFPVPNTPKTINDTTLCLNDPSFTLKAQGTDMIRWYNDMKVSIPIPPQINTSIPGPQIYYVTQNNGKCESQIDEGKITVRITDRSETNRINLPESLDLCPNNSVEIKVSSQVEDPNPVFKWYRFENKTSLIQEGPSLQTPVLKHDTVYYVTITYGGLCESNYPKAAVVYVRDIELPNITAPPSMVISTNDGVCYASGIDVGFPVISDNCTDVDKLIVYTDIYHPGVFPTYFSLGDTTLVWWVVDEAGNRSRGLQTITVRDREKPRGTCPSDIFVDINDHENSAIVTYQLDYTDNCGFVKDSLVMGLASGAKFPFGTTRVRHLLIDKVGNTEICEFNVVVQYPYRPMEVDLRVLPKTMICPGEQVVITPIINGGSGRYTYSWKTPRYWTEPEMRDYPFDDTTYELTVSDGITNETRTVHISVLETKQVELTLVGRRMDEIFEDDEILVTATTGFISYKLLLNNEVVQTSGSNNGVSFQAELGIYTVRVFATDLNNCVTQDQLEIIVDSRKLPNIFTPNYDGKNDIFLAGFDLEIYSRAGQLLYKGFNGWDGTFKGKMMPQGAYLYVVRRIMNNGELRIFKDVVTLKL